MPLLQKYRRERLLFLYLLRFAWYNINKMFILSMPLNRRTANSVLFIAGMAALLFGSFSIARGDELQNAAHNLKAKYAGELKQLAALCEEKGLKEQARQTLALLGPTDPVKFYVPVLPDEVGPAKVPDGASPEIIEWDTRLNKLRRDHSAALYELARRAVRSKHAGLALELVLDAVRANPDNETVRRLLGYQKYQDQWHTLYEVKKLRSGMVWHDKFGWLPKTHVRRYEQGDRYNDGKWITAAEDARIHNDIRSGWDIETEHFSVRTNQSLEAGVAMGVKLEDLYRVWQQMFIGYFVSEPEVIALFDGRARPQRQIMRYQVVCFRDKDDYVRSLSEAMPDVGISVGAYLNSMRVAYFFTGDGSDDRTLYHEATHQLFHESRKVSASAGRRYNYWILEGIAMYMESLKKENGYYELGGFDDLRLAAAQFRLLEDHFYVPLEELTSYGMEKLQKDPKIATLYSQSAGLTHFLIHYDHGRYRDALVSYLTAVYTGHDNPDTLLELTGTGYSELDKQYREFMEQKSSEFRKAQKSELRTQN
jgi:hypothetical protein